jgi:tetratricopeptide (TPR) repeat protein
MLSKRNEDKSRLMKRSCVFVAVLTAIISVVGCNTDPDAAKKKYVERGNAYAEKGKYKEALIMYRNALKKDSKYGEAYYRAGLVELRVATEANDMTGKFLAARDFYRGIEFQPDNMDAYGKLTDIFIEAYIRDRRHPLEYVTEMKSLQERLAKRHPTSYEYLRLSGYLALSDNKKKDAISFFTQADKLKPSEPDVTLILMRTLQQDNQPQEAERIGKVTLEKNPKNMAMYDALFMLYLSQQRMSDAEKIVQDKVRAFPDNANAYLQLASFYMANRKNDEMRRTIDTLTQDPKRFPKGYENAGDFYLRTRHMDDALRVYRAGMEKYPDRKADFLQRIIEVYTLEGNLVEANKLFAELKKDRPNDDNTLAIGATLRMLGGKKDELQGALDDLQALMTRRPSDPVIRFNLGRAYLMRGNSQQAAIQFEEAIKIKPDYVQPQLSLAEILAGKREFGRVIQITDEVLQTEPANRQAQLLRTRALLGIGEFKTARNELNGMLKDDPNLTEAKLQLAVLDNVTQNPKGAEASYRAIYEKTKDSRALIGLAQSLVTQNRTEDAIKLLSDEVKRDPSRSDYRIILGNLCVKAGKYNEAVSQYNEILKNDPKDSDTWVRLGETQRISGDKQAAMAAFKKALDVSPNNTNALLQLGMLYDGMGQYKESQPLYQRVLRTDAENGVALNNMAFVMAENGGDLDAALNMAQRAKQRLPQQLDVLDTLGWIYMKKNLSDSAIQLFREIVRQDPNRSTFRYHLGMALAQKGNKVEAKRELDTALTKKPDREEEAKIRELMAKLG